MGIAPADYYDSTAATFMHRPYHRMPLTSFAMSYLFGLASNGPRGREILSGYCRAAALDPTAVQTEMRSRPDLIKLVQSGDIDMDVYPLSLALLKHFRTSKAYETLVASKMSLGSELMKDIGNVYCAALPAWMAAGFEDALERDVDLEGKPVLAVGYGSGDAAEAIPMTVARNWRRAAARINFSDSLERYQTLTQSQYESLHDNGRAVGLVPPIEGFVVDSVGASTTPGINDDGVEYYSLLN
jgi:hydroxymethylglutaryl-CoA synthase